MESFFSRYKNALVLIIVLLAQVVGLAIQVRRPLPREHAQPDAGGVRLIRYWAISLVTPPERFVHWLGESILGVWDNYVDLIHVRQQNKDLQGEIRRLRIEQGGIVEDARQGQRLQQLLSFEEKYIYKTVAAQIIGSSGAEQSRILSINKGAKDGLAVDMPVITPDGIVGRIREVFPHTSQVLEITDPASGAGVMLATTRIRGILRGNAVGQPQVVNVLPDDRIKAGEQVVTSGGDQIFPRGLAVGTVDRVMVDPDRDPLVDVLIHPAANLSQLEEVLVITDTENSATPRQKLDMLQSAAAASAEQLKASEILAERLPSRIDPDAPQTDASGEETASAAGGDPGRPLRPLLAVRADRFSPNSTPSATSLTPGARLAPQSEGTGRVTPRPRPVAAPTVSNSASSETTVKKKAPEPVLDNGSRPAAAAMARPRPPAEGSPAVPRTSGSIPGTTTAHSTTNPGAGLTAQPRQPGISGAAGTTAAVPHVPATRPANNPETGTEAVRRTPAGTAPVTGNHTATVETETNPSGVAPSPKTHVVVDGPLPSTARKPATPSTAAPAQQHPPVATGQRPAANVGTTTPRTSPGTNPGTTSGTNPATTGTRPAAAPQRKGPELVPDDGSRPPPTMLHPNQPRPQTQPRPANPAPQQQTQPQGGR